MSDILLGRPVSPLAGRQGHLIFVSCPTSAKRTSGRSPQADADARESVRPRNGAAPERPSGGNGWASAPRSEARHLIVAPLEGGGRGCCPP